MIHIQCQGCNNHCCGHNPFLTPVLLRSEEEYFKEYSNKIQTPHGEIWTLEKKENGNCIFLEDKTMRCTIYPKRPLECQLYPFLLDFDKGVPDAKLDKRYCPHLNTLSFDMESIAALLKKHTFPQDWIKAYQSLKEC